MRVFFPKCARMSVAQSRLLFVRRMNSQTSPPLPARRLCMASPLRAGARVVVTGAAGRHGRLVTALLLKRGYDVLATDMAPWPGCPTRFQQADLGGDDAATAELLRGAAGVVHLAAGALENAAEVADVEVRRVVAEPLFLCVWYGCQS